MALDIAAIQAIYGVNMNYASGGNVYMLPTSNGPGVWATLHLTNQPLPVVGISVHLTLIGAVSFFGKLDTEEGASFTAGIDPTGGTISSGKVSGSR